MHISHSIQAVTMFLCLDTQHSGCNSVSLLRQYTSLHTAGATDGNTVSLFSLLLTWTAWSVSRVTDTTNALPFVVITRQNQWIFSGGLACAGLFHMAAGT